LVCDEALVTPARAAASATVSAAPRPLDPTVLPDHVDRLYRAAWASCGSREDAEDLVQDTYARVLAKPRLLRREDDTPDVLTRVHGMEMRWAHDPRVHADHNPGRFRVRRN